MSFRAFFKALICAGFFLAHGAFAQYKGGISDGFSRVTLTQSTCGPIIASGNYSGGVGDGSAWTVLNQDNCAALFSNVNFFGSTGDGSSSGRLTGSVCAPANQEFAYFGGFGDGYDVDTLTQQNCPALFLNVNFFGGINEGYSSGNLQQNTCTPLPFGFTFFGGDGDGYSRDTLTQQTCAALFVNVNFFGGVQDGYSRVGLVQNTCAPLAEGLAFFGGSGDGFSRDSIIQQLCPATFVNVNYFGGTHEGFASSNLIQSTCPTLQFNTNYFGGNADGYFASVLQQSNCPALLYYYRTIANGNWNTLTTWEFSTDPAYINPAPAVATTPPAFNNSYEIVVRSPHSVSINSAIVADDLKINSGGTLSVLAGGNLTLNDGTAASDLLIDGTLNLGSTSTLQAGSAVINNGLWSTSTNALSSAATITHTGTATYRHGVDGGIIPTATWNSGSTLQITGMINATSIAGMNQSFHHVVYNCTGQVTPFVDLDGNIQAINGNLSISSTGTNTREVRIFNTTANANPNLTVGGNVMISTGSRLSITGGATSGAANPTLTINGDLTLNGSAIMDMTGNGIGTSTGTNVTLLGNLSINGTSGLQRSQATPAVFRFNKAGGTQTYLAGTPSSAISLANINFIVGNGTTNPELVLSSDFIMNSSAQLNVSSNSVLNAGTQIVRGNTAGVDGSFTLNNNATLITANSNGISGPLASVTGSVQTGIVRNFSNAAIYIYRGTTNQITGNGLPLTLVNPGELRIENSGPALNNTVTLTTTGTTTPLLTLQSGRFAAGTGGTLNISNAGNVVVTAGDFATGAAGGTLNALGTATFSGNSNPYTVYTSGGVDFGTGTVTIQNGGSFRINSGGFVNNNAAFYASGSTLEYNTGGNFERSFEWSASSGRGYPHHVNLLSTNLNAARVSSSYAAVSLQTAGNLDIQTGSSLQMNFGGSNMTVPLVVNGNITFAGLLSASQAAGGNIEVRGNWVNNGTGITFSPNGRTVTFNGTAAQSLGGSNSAINPFSVFVVNNASGLSLTGADIQVDNQITLQAGRVNLNNRTLTLGKTGVDGTLLGGSSTAYFNSGNTNSKFVRFTTATNVNYAFPVGTTSSYSPVTVNLYNGTSVNSNSRISTHVVPGSHPNLGTSTNYLNRYWGVEPLGFGTSVFYGINYVYNDADVVGIEANLKPFKYNTSGWIAAAGSGAVFEMGSGTVNPGTNTIDWQGLYSFSDFTANGNGTPLPITLLEFNAKPLLDKVELTWTTATEINNDYFTIERSKDAVNFTPIETVDGAGNSNSILFYKTMDEEPLEGLSYYRLKQTDFDGEFEYSDIRVVNFLKPGSNQDWLVFPNPSEMKGINLSANNLINESIDLVLTDIAGKLVYSKTIAAKNNQVQEFVNFGEIASGVYNLSLSDGSNVKNVRLIMTR